MNAYELADELDILIGIDAWAKDASTMLRQQAKRIEELEKDLHMVERHYDSLESSLKVNQECNSMEMNKPVTYWDGKHFASKEKSSLADIPLYTAPHHASDVKQYRELSDDFYDWVLNFLYEKTAYPKEVCEDFARAILKKASEK